MGKEKEREREEGKECVQEEEDREGGREVGKGVSIGERRDGYIHREGGRMGEEIRQRKRGDVNIHSSRLINSWFCAFSPVLAFTRLSITCDLSPTDRQMNGVKVDSQWHIIRIGLMLTNASVEGVNGKTNTIGLNNTKVSTG